MSFSDRSYCSCAQCWMTGLSVSQFELCTSHQDQIGATLANTESHFPTKNKKHTRLPRITLLISFRQKQLRQRDLFSILLIRDCKHIEKTFSNTRLSQKPSKTGNSQNGRPITWSIPAQKLKCSRLVTGKFNVI